MEYKLKGKVWLWTARLKSREPSGWHFVSVNKKVSREIKEDFGGGSGGFGSIPVEVTVGKTKWKTSIFPDSKSGTYLLPLKAEVRKKEGIENGKMLDYMIRIV